MNEFKRGGSAMFTVSEAVGVNAGLRRFPPGNPYLLVPVTSRKAALAGLSLYDAVSPRQRGLLGVGRTAARLGLIRLMPSRREVAAIPGADWWRDWLRDVAQPVVGRVRFCARSVGEARVRCLLLADDGSPLAFGKAALASAAEGLRREVAAHTLLQQEHPRRFRAPRLLDQGQLGDWAYLLFDAIPDVGHRPLTGDPQLVAGVVDELQACLDGLPKDAGVPTGHVPGHGDFSPRNARVAADGRVWVIDWEEAGWMPRLADELRFWAAYAGGGRQPGGARRRAHRVVRMLRARGSDHDILEAAAWPEFNTAGEQAVRDAVSAIVASRGA